MAVALPIDKELVKALWLQGFTAKKIEERTGVPSATLRVWVTRYKWDREGKTQRLENQRAQNATVEAVAQRLSGQAVELAERIMCFMRDSKLKTLNDCKTASTALAASYATARKALGMDDANAVQRHVHYHVMDRARASVAQGVVIDAVEVPQPAQVADTPGLDQPYTELPAGRPEECAVAAEDAKDDAANQTPGT